MENKIKKNKPKNTSLAIYNENDDITNINIINNIANEGDNYEKCFIKGKVIGKKIQNKVKWKEDYIDTIDIQSHKKYYKNIYANNHRKPFRICGCILF